MKWSALEKKIDDGIRNFIFVTKPRLKSFMVYNYARNSIVDTVLRLFDVWGMSADYKYQLPEELYSVFKTESARVAADKLGLSIFFQEELED